MITLNEKKKSRKCKYVNYVVTTVIHIYYGVGKSIRHRRLTIVSEL